MLLFGGVVAVAFLAWRKIERDLCYHKKIIKSSHNCCTLNEFIIIMDAIRIGGISVAYDDTLGKLFAKS